VGGKDGKDENQNNDESADKGHEFPLLLWHIKRSPPARIIQKKKNPGAAFAAFSAF